MTTRITILCENTAGIPFGVIGEHGFSCYVETEKGNYLFDTGQGLGLARNAAVLGKDLGQIRCVMISHGHYDHTGGLPDVLRFKSPLDVYGHPGMFIERVGQSKNNASRRFIGIPYRREYLESLGARFRFETGMKEVGPGVWLTGEIPRNSPFEKPDPNMIAIGADGREIQPDSVPDDLSMIVESEKGLILVLGCAHAGMINIINHVMETTKRDRIYAIIGGTHLGFAEDAQFDETLRLLDEYQVEKIGVSHCTGQARASAMHARLKDRFFFGSVGTVLEG